MPDEPRDGPSTPPEPLDDLSDEELAAIEADLHRAAREHRIELDDVDLPSVEHSVPGEPDFEAAAARAEDLRDAVESIAGAARPEPEAGLEEKLQDVERRARAARKTKTTRLQPGDSGRQAEFESAQGLGVGVSAAYAILGLPLLGFLIGKAVDGPGSTQWQSWLAVAGIGLGIAFALFQLGRHNRRGTP